MKATYLVLLKRDEDFRYLSKNFMKIWLKYFHVNEGKILILELSFSFLFQISGLTNNGVKNRGKK